MFLRMSRSIESTKRWAPFAGDTGGACDALSIFFQHGILLKSVFVAISFDDRYEADLTYTELP